MSIGLGLWVLPKAVHEHVDGMEIIALDGGLGGGVAPLKGDDGARSVMHDGISGIKDDLVGHDMDCTISLDGLMPDRILSLGPEIVLTYADGKLDKI